MSDNWELYYCRVDDKPAYIFFDINISNEVDKSKYPYLGYVKVILNEPSEEGLPTDAEFESLVKIEGHLRTVLTQNGSAVYVGRNSSDGYLVYYFYLSSENSWEAQAKLAMNNFQQYKFESGKQDDQDWSIYLDFIYPSDRDWETIKSRRVCENLYKNGDTMQKEREIDHWLYFENSIKRETYIAKVEHLGYQVRSKMEPDSVNPRYGLQVYHTATPSPYVSLELYDLALECDSEYDGWETEIIC